MMVAERNFDVAAKSLSQRSISSGKVNVRARSSAPMTRMWRIQLRSGRGR